MKEQALTFATDAHREQIRKSSKEPYITHPIRVADRLAESGGSDELITAAYLHDVVEDTPIEIDDIETRFGSRVAHIVAAHTEDKSKSWHERKQHTIDTVATADPDVKHLIVADKLDNLLEMEKELASHGTSVWKHFNAGFNDQKWYNESIAINMEKGLSADAIPEFFTEFKQAVQRVFGESV